MMELNAFEHRALRFILEIEEPAFLPVLDDLRVVRRRHTGKGVFVDFAEHPPVEVQQRSRRYGNAVIGVIHGSDDVVRFELIREGGRLADLEIFSNDGNTLPEDLDHVRLERLKAVATGEA